MVLEHLMCPMNFPFSAHIAQKTWCGHPHPTKMRLGFRKVHGLPRIITLASGRGSAGSLEHVRSPEMPGKGHVSVWKAHGAGVLEEDGGGV